MIDRMKEELRGVVLNLNEYEGSALRFVEESRRAEVLNNINKLKAECRHALDILSDVDEVDRLGKEGIKGGVLAIKRKAISIIWPDKAEEKKVPVCQPENLADQAAE